MDDMDARTNTSPISPRCLGQSGRPLSHSEVAHKASVPEMAASVALMACCQCGTPIEPNATSMCVACVSATVDVTEGIATQHSIHRCRGCQKWLGPQWTEAELESRELLALCVRKIRGLNKLKLVDAAWIWTEPHSMRLKLKLTVQKEVAPGAILQQPFVVEFVIRNRQCTVCSKEFCGGAWKAVVQVRQRVAHKRTFFYLEQLVMRHGAHSTALSVEQFRDGLDFYFSERNTAVRFIDFLENHLPVTTKVSKKLISADLSSNDFHNKHSYLCELPRACKDDILLLPAPFARSQGDLSRLVLVQRVNAEVRRSSRVVPERRRFQLWGFG